MTQLYLITPPHFELEKFIPQLTSALEDGGVNVLQLRMKSLAADGTYTAEPNWAEVKMAAAEIMPICKKFGVAFILNDNPQLAVELGADGVHVGSEDISVEDAREIVGDDMFVGASCYASKDLAFEAGEQGADYVAFGAFYETQTKKPKGRPTPDLIEFWQEYTTIPCVAIGGITPENAEPIVKAGADFIAVVTGVWNHPKGAKTAVAEFNKVFEKFGKKE
jgi:thiamine-phosphate pyrophosphorylase